MSPMGLELAWKATSKLNFFPQLKSIVTTILPGRSPMSNHQNFPKNQNFQKNLKFLKNMKFLLLFKVVLTLVVVVVAVVVAVAVAAKSEKTLSSPSKHKSLHLKQNSLALKHKSHWRHSTAAGPPGRALKPHTVSLTNFSWTLQVKSKQLQPTIHGSGQDTKHLPKM